MALPDIKHVVFLMLENRSFDHMLGYLSLERTPDRMAEVDGLKDDPEWLADRANHGDGQVYAIDPAAPLDPSEKIQDPPHGIKWVRSQITTRTTIPGPRAMGGFVQSYLDSRRQNGKPLPKRPGDVMGFFDHKAMWAFDFLAHQYCVCDRWFTPLPTGTQPNRLMAMAGSTKIASNKKLIPAHDMVYDWCDRNGIDWAAYVSGGFLPFFALMPKWWDDILDKNKQSRNFFRFRRLKEHWNGPAEPPSVIFVEPEYSEGRSDKANDDHAPTRTGGGQTLLADLYDVLTGNPARWAKTLLIVTYDEHGGFFDHVYPPKIKPPMVVAGETFATAGPRVPALLVSPHIDAGRVCHEVVDHTAFLSLLAELFTPGQPYSDAVANRQGRFEGGYGKLTNVFRAAPRTGKPPRLVRPVEVKSAKGTPPGLSRSDIPPDADTPTAVGFHEAAHRTAKKKPAMVGDSDWQGLTFYVENRPAPVETPDEHIADD